MTCEGDRLSRMHSRVRVSMTYSSGAQVRSVVHSLLGNACIGSRWTYGELLAGFVPHT